MISVAMCTYNGEAFIEEQLISIIGQTKQPDEIVICDDCSQDNTIQKAEEVLSAWSGNVKIIKNTHNLGYRLNFQKAISLCTGDIIFLSDQDDVWDLKKIEIIYRTFLNHPEIKLVFHDAVLVDQRLQLLHSSFWHLLSFNPDDFSRNGYKRLLLGNVVQGSACAFCRELFGTASPFPKEAVHDEWLALVAAISGGILPVSQPLMKYRQGNNQIGGEVRTFRQGIHIWRTKFRESVRKHVQQIENRKMVLGLLSQRYSSSIGLDFYDELNKIEFFFNMRIQYILGEKNFINWNQYLKYCVDYRQAIRQSLKDIFVKLYCQKNKIMKYRKLR